KAFTGISSRQWRKDASLRPSIRKNYPPFVAVSYNKWWSEVVENHPKPPSSQHDLLVFQTK
ncbi:MAG: hypothetical protein KDE58_36985, partial [Caldilineaceae bacterium]|nr:hypothetical protein [Caldilineaceae bacterium]